MPIDATEANAVIQERWRTVAFPALFSKMVAKNRILNVTQDIADHGDILHMAVNPTPTVGSITAATGAYTAEDVTISNVDLTVDQWRYVAHDIVDRADIQADIDLIQNFSKAFVPALGQDIEQAIFGLWDDVSVNGEIGNATTGEAFGDELILPAILTLDNLRIEQENRSFLLPPVAFAQLMKTEKFVDAHKTGLPKGVMTNGILSDLYGNPAYKSPEVVISGVIRKGLYLHRDGLAVAIQRNFKIEKFARTQFSTPVACSVLYGVAVARDNHVSPLNIKNTLV